MMNIWLYIRAIGRHWWALLSCAGFTVLSLYTLHANKDNNWAFKATLALSAGFLIIATFLAWRDEHLANLRGVTDRKNLEQMYFDQRPVLGLTVIGVSTPREWREAVNSRNPPAHFFLQHLSGRVAKSVHIDPIHSLRGKFTLCFDPLPFVDPPVQKGMKYKVLEDGIPPDPRVLESIGWGAMLDLFLSDSPADIIDLRYSITVRFKDLYEERSQAFTLVFNAKSMEFYID
jgi:hypothetical protein